MMKDLNSQGGLYIVSVPIGNLDDITERAKFHLENTDIIACEDTRITGQLIEKLHLNKKGTFRSYREENEQQITEQIIYEIQAGKNVSLVSDAGTPAISDPGFRLISTCRKLNLPVTAVPGACALINALCLSGLPTDSFLFLGFLPAKTSARKKTFTIHQSQPYTLIIYESCHRIEKCLEDIISVLGPQRIISVCREMTKLYETVITGTSQYVLDSLKTKSKKGEFVVIIAKDSFSL